MKKIMIIIALFISMGHANNINANVIAVQTSGDEGAYRFAVTIKSTETGCAQYADWWEVVSAKGVLLYRRVLVHSHPDTQPFTRSGGSVKIDKDDTVYVRAHMNTLGYVGDVFEGSASKGFKKSNAVPLFPKSLETREPLPKGCAY